MDLCIDERHQEGFLETAALVSLSPRAALFGDSRQAHLKAQQSGEIQLPPILEWMHRKGVPIVELPVSRLGHAITEALVATGDRPNARSSPMVPPTVLLPILFELCGSHRSAGREVYMLPPMMAHLIFGVCWKCV